VGERDDGSEQGGRDREVAVPVEGVRVVPLRRFDDERGWFLEARRESWFEGLGGQPSRQTNIVFSRRGVIRGLHFHEAGQDDLFFCATGEVRVVVFDRRPESPTHGTAWSRDIGESNPEAIYIPGRVAHGYEALTDCLFCYHVTHEYDPAAPDEHGFPWNDARVRHLWSAREPILSSRDRV
jgi:dTDP-4-dehydrorhamnose 3,5-epimerase